MDLSLGTFDQEAHIQRLESYVKSLQEEKLKIEAFKKELPYCMQLLNEAIDAATGCLRESKIKRDGMSSLNLKLELFQEKFGTGKLESPPQLNQVSELKLSESYARSKNVSSDAFDLRLSNNKMVFDQLGYEDAKRTVSSERMILQKLPVLGICSNGNQQRKARRCWSPELHKRFINALQQLGGSQVATPKQIRELMKVDGLTNDEVKSHLQKYRLHTRRPATVTTAAPQSPQVVVVGGIWMPQEFTHQQYTHTHLPYQQQFFKKLPENEHILKASCEEEDDGDVTEAEDSLLLQIGTKEI